jgi:hypothetical protein
MKRGYLIFAVLGVLALIAMLTNPNQDRHKEVVKNKINLFMQKSMKQNLTEKDNEWEQLGQAFGMMLGGALVDRIVDNFVSTDNYVLFSTTKVSWEGKTKIIGIGAFGNVFISSKLDEAINEGLLEN